MQRGEPSPQSNQNFERRRRTQSKYNKDAPRYECFCSKQYLSYPALYLHMKNKHVDYFQNSKNGRVQPTKLIQSFNVADGYKIYKIAGDSLHKDLYSGKYYEQNYMDNKANFQANGNYMRFTHMGYPHYGFGSNGNNEIDEKKEASIQIALSMYMQTIKDKPMKQKYQTQLFFVLLVDCINKNYQLLKDSRTDSQEVRRYTAQYNCQKMMEILPYFQTQYLPSLADPSKPTSFFVKYSYIITSGEYKNVLKAFISYIDDKLDKSHLRKTIEAPLPSFSQQEAEAASEQISQKDQPQDDDEDDGDEYDENELQNQGQS